MVSIAQLEQENIAESKRVCPNIGDKVSVSVEISEGEKSRIQKFEGLVIAIHKGGPRTTFTVRKETLGIGVERVFPLYSPLVKEIKIKVRHKVRRAKLYYQRQLRGKKARLKTIRSSK
ncbi:MAG: 50S ribosomal protein L19 [Proteobacteria bacterium]|nr:50S ribosomal protein L19 [Pseudomonadota bacterium]